MRIRAEIDSCWRFFMSVGFDAKAHLSLAGIPEYIRGCRSTN